MSHDESSLLRGLICFNFYRGWRGISEYYRHYLPENVSAQQSYVLELCDEHVGLGVGEVAAALEIELPAISALLRRMEASGLVRRAVPQENRRRTLVFLTPNGVLMREKVRTVMHEADQALGRFISEKDVAQLVRIVDKVRKAVAGR